jgi:hypothetical protein
MSNEHGAGALIPKRGIGPAIPRGRSAAAGLRRSGLALFLALVWLAPAAPAEAFDFSAPVKMARRILGQKPPAASPDKPGGSAGVRQRNTAVPVSGQPNPAANGGVSPATAAPADSADRAMLDNIILSPEPYYYQSIGRRDPFVSLVSSDGGDDSDEPPSGKLTVRGILWGENDRFALVETAQGENYILRQGDRCGRFSVTRIEPDGITVYWSEYGVGKSQRLPLIQGKGSKDERDAR